MATKCYNERLEKESNVSTELMAPSRPTQTTSTKLKIKDIIRNVYFRQPTLGDLHVRYVLLKIPRENSGANVDQNTHPTQR